MTSIINSESGWVAGRSADGHGILTGWHGRRDMTRGGLVEVADKASIPREWLPSVKDASVQLGRAMQEIAGIAYTAKPVRKRDAQALESEPITWTARWVLYTRPQGNEAAQPGSPYGVIALRATLYETEGDAPFVVYERNQADARTIDLANEVNRAFESRLESQRYTAADVTKWLGDLLRRRLGAVRYGGNWYVPYVRLDDERNARDVAEVLIETIRATGWGTNYLYPPLPIATSAQLSLGLALGLQDEVTEVMNEMGAAREYARGQGRPDIGERACQGYLEKLGVITKRVHDKAELLGPERVKESLDAIADATILVDGILEAIALAEFRAA